MNVCLFFPLSTHFVHYICILLCKDHVHGIVLFCKAEHAGMLAVFLITCNFRGFLRFLHVQRANRTPTNALETLIIFLLVLILPNRIQKESLQYTNGSYKIISCFQNTAIMKKQGKKVTTVNDRKTRETYVTLYLIHVSVQF